MSRWSTRRGQTEPLAAIAAVLAVGIGLTAYAGVLSDALPSPGRNLAEPTLERVHAEVTVGGVSEPSRLPTGLAAGPDGYDVNLTLAVADRTWHAGPPGPPNADTASRIISVRVGPGRVSPGRLRVEVWE